MNTCKEKIKMKIEFPIFIVGVGRSGSSIFHEILSNHPHTAWLSQFSERYPQKPSINRNLLKIIDYPIFGKFLKKYFKPEEAYNFWNFYCNGFDVPCRDLFSEDVTKRAKLKLRQIMSELTTKKRNRLLFKITGWPRIGYLKEIFEDARFIHIIRDGRAAAYSLTNVDWWWGWRGPHNWRWGELSLKQKNEWESHNKSFIALAALEWKILMDAFEESKKKLENSEYLEVRYENLCSNPLKVIKKVTDFCGLTWTKEFEIAVNNFRLTNFNDKWKEDLNEVQKNDLQNILQEYLTKYEYL
jgi:hypothetical protein